MREIIVLFKGLLINGFRGLRNLEVAIVGIWNVHDDREGGCNYCEGLACGGSSRDLMFIKRASVFRSALISAVNCEV